MESNQNYIPPNQTLYVNNLNEKIKIDELKENLFHLFSEFGDIISIITKNNAKMRGQAFIIFKDINSAKNAKLSLNHFIFLGKELNINYSKNPSKILSSI
jgi:RNA recognition motif-containing protein